MNYNYIILSLVIPLSILFIVVNIKEKELNRIKDKKVGDGQYGTAKWINEKEKKETYRTVAYEPQKWRNGENKDGLIQGLIVGMKINMGRTIAMLDSSDSNTDLVGPSGIGKTNFFLMPQIEYAAG